MGLLSVCRFTHARTDLQARIQRLLVRERCLLLTAMLSVGGGIEHSQALANSAFTKPHGPEIRIMLFDGFVDEQESAPSRMEQVVRLQRCPVAHLPRWQR